MAAIAEAAAPGERPQRGAVSGVLRALRRRSIRLLLSAASLLLLIQAILLGTFCIQRLSDVNRVSEEIRSQWLQDMRLLGDLNNYMSDYRTGEGTYLLSHTALETSASVKEIAQLDERVTRAQRGYEALPHDRAERALYHDFALQWGAYKVLAAQVLMLARSGRQADAVAMYMTGSRHAFDLASDTLGDLTDQTVARAAEARARADSTYRRDRRLILAAMAVAALLVTAIIVYITGWVSGPLLGLARRMRALAAQDTSLGVPFTAREDEIGEMARSICVFRDNAIALVSSQRRLQEQAAVLEETLEKERHLAARQRNFVTMTSHEFRTPLTVIDAQAQRLIKLKDQIGPADLLERAGRIRGAVRRLTGIMDSLLDAGRLFDGETGFHPVEFSPAELLREVCQLHRDTRRGADIREDLAHAPAVVTGDPKLLSTAVSNLLSNALKYSEAGSPVEVRACAQAPGQWVVEVRDHGIGIPEKDRPRLFERYFRGGNAIRVAGSGVGLHVVAMVVALHGGSIDVSSREGEGSTFSMRLPCRAVNSARAPVSEDA